MSAIYFSIVNIQSKIAQGACTVTITERKVNEIESPFVHTFIPYIELHAIFIIYGFSKQNLFM